MSINIRYSNRENKLQSLPCAEELVGYLTTVLSLSNEKSRLGVIYKWAYVIGRPEKEDYKPCVTSVTIIMLEKKIRQWSPSF